MLRIIPGMQTSTVRGGHLILVTMLLIINSSQTRPTIEGKLNFILDFVIKGYLNFIHKSVDRKFLNNFCLDGTDTKWDHPFIRVSYSDLYPNTFSSLQSPQYLVEVPISVREMENIY